MQICTHTCTYVRMNTCIHAHRQRRTQTPTQTYINVGYATLDTSMIRPILIDPKVSILHMYSFTMFLQFQNHLSSLIDRFGMRLIIM